MKRERLMVRPINKKTDTLPDDTLGRWVLLIKRNNIGQVEARQTFFCHHTACITVPGFTHYVIIPNYLHQP